jgi:hypothetical protein
VIVAADHGNAGRKAARDAWIRRRPGAERSASPGFFSSLAELVESHTFRYRCKNLKPSNRMRAFIVRSP